MLQQVLICLCLLTYTVVEVITERKRKQKVLLESLFRPLQKMTMLR